MSEIEKINPEEVVVDPVSAGVKTKIGEEDFIKEFVKVIKEGPVWRSSKKLAEIFGVDIKELEDWMDRVTQLAKRPGKEEGIVYYASVNRLEKEEEKQSPPGMGKKQITEIDRYLIALLHMDYSNLVNILEKYALHAHSRNKEAFAKLVEARDALSAGITLLANTIQLDITKLPKL